MPVSTEFSLLRAADILLCLTWGSRNSFPRWRLYWQLFTLDFKLSPETSCRDRDLPPGLIVRGSYSPWLVIGSTEEAPSPLASSWKALPSLLTSHGAKLRHCDCIVTAPLPLCFQGQDPDTLSRKIPKTPAQNLLPGSPACLKCLVNRRCSINTCLHNWKANCLVGKPL